MRLPQRSPEARIKRHGALARGAKSGTDPCARCPRTGAWGYDIHGAYMTPWYAMWAQRYMHDFGVTNADLAQVAVTHRYHATLNPDSVMGRRGEITFDDIYRFFPVLKEKRRQLSRELSGGQQQMVAVGRALLANPKLLLCDEISLGLAPTIIKDLYEIIPTIRARGIGILVVEQDISRSLAVADRFYCLLEGKVNLSGRPADVDHDTVVKHYFGL